MSDNYEKLKELVASVADDVSKASSGNKAATTRVRKIMQDVKNVSNDIRKDMIAVRSAD
jgi:hypothetical protein